MCDHILGAKVYRATLARLLAKALDVRLNSPLGRSRAGANAHNPGLDKVGTPLAG
jgi:hypothetical protein